MALTTDIIDDAVDRYWREIDRYTKLAEFVGDACRALSAGPCSGGRRTPDGSARSC
jgi:hypothetical protein